jgi:hypothetical protein
MRPFQYCGKKECIERQELGQVSELEATVETCQLAQSRRVLDRRIAVTKYRRSAAGGNDSQSIRSREELQRTLSHLTQICATLRATPDHPPLLHGTDTIVEFVTDRLRACQSDATKLMAEPGTCVPSSWHASVIRVLIWLRYACQSTAATGGEAAANATARTIDHMKSTAYDAYWNTTDRQQGRDDDDEMLCYDAISRICAVSKHSATNYAMSLETSWNSILLECSKRRRPGSVYPLWNLALTIASHVRRDEYYVLWKSDRSLVNQLPVLAKSIVSGEALLLWRYRTVQHYNKSFGKGEPVSDMDRLLGIGESDTSDDGWSVEYANVFGVPVEEAKNDENNTTVRTRPTITMKLKQVAMPEWNSNKADTSTLSRIRKADRQWIFGDDFDGASPLGMSSEAIRRLLEFGCSPPIGIDTLCHKFNSNNPITNVNSPQIPTSLSMALAETQPRCRTSPLQTAIDRVKLEKKKKACRFYRTSKGCRFGDQCRFDHTM